MLAPLDVAVADGDLTFDAELRRESDEAEFDRLNRVVQSAFAEFCGRMREPRPAG